MSYLHFVSYLHFTRSYKNCNASKHESFLFESVNALKVTRPTKTSGLVFLNNRVYLPRIPLIYHNEIIQYVCI